MDARARRNGGRHGPLKRGRISFGTILLVVAAATASGCCAEPSRSGLAPSVTRTAVRSITIGMERTQLEHAIGRPITEATDTAGRLRLDYARRASTACPYPMVWVYLKDGRVDEVYVKLDQGWSDNGLYALTADKRWEAPGFVKAIPD